MVLYFFNWKVQWMLANQFKCIGNVKGSKKNGQRFPLLADHVICFPEAILFWVFVDPQKFNMFFCGSTKSQCYFLWIHILNCNPSTLFCGSTILNFYFCGSTILRLFFFVDPQKWKYLVLSLASLIEIGSFVREALFAMIGYTSLRRRDWIEELLCN